ncbi:YnbE family lipoprotein [Croceicoccus bisphenolivorans]|uniref:YnbE family lipoprotein n=1 Tax=Croceicoccus bisphenolivorans TaxID=1783232 RepID=UPI00316AD648
MTLGIRDANTAPTMDKGVGMAHGGWFGAVGAGTVAPLFLAATGCVNVNAPAEPIVIELNVNIKQEVLYRLVDSANENIEENPEIF